MGRRADVHLPPRDGGAWTTALTNQSADVRAITTGTNSVTVTYQSSANAKGVKNFKLVETYALVNDYLSWQITVTNTSTQTMEIGDFGLPLPFNEYWSQANDVIYETRTVYHSFTGNNDSYITVERPSGVGPFILMTPDQTTGAGFEYMDNWVAKEHSGSAWAAGGGTPSVDRTGSTSSTSTRTSSRAPTAATCPTPASRWRRAPARPTASSSSTSPATPTCRTGSTARG